MGAGQGGESGSMAPEDLELPEGKLPYDSDLQQQRLKAWQPIIHPKQAFVVLLISGLAMIGIGAFVEISNAETVEFSQRYDDRSACSVNTNTSAPAVYCNVTLDIQKKMEGPLQFSYQLTSYFQNYRRYVKSRSDWQLADVAGTLETCDPLENFGNKTLYPCGLVASSFFNDSFTAFACGSSGTDCVELTGNSWKETGIAWKSDRDKLFKERPLESGETNIGPNGFALPAVNNEHFIVWMRAAGLPKFRKLYSTIDRGFSEGDKLIIQINSNYPVSTFSGSKSIVLEETSWMDGKNNFLGALYMTVGSMATLSAIIFAIIQYKRPRPLADPNSIPDSCRAAW
mmetsp:Transcript_10004/g.18199  ORF Transcript_10004/g.18199 Transcript_10004/m.18199 type:complete len:342 (+) Transcript_10004:21-1046(+)